jgi:hypothetical protein
VLSVLMAAAAVGQSPTVRNATVLLPDCPYRQCELSYVPGRFGGHLEVGVGVLAEIGGGPTGAGIVRAVAAVPAAARIARAGQRAQTSATAIRVVAVVATAIAWQQAGKTLDPQLARLFIGTGGLLLFSVGPLVPQDMAHDRFGRAADAYNRELGR